MATRIEEAVAVTASGGSAAAVADEIKPYRIHVSFLPADLYPTTS